MPAFIAISLIVWLNFFKVLVKIMEVTQIQKQTHRFKAAVRQLLCSAR